MMKELGIYLHFPFCVRKCGYCDFLSFPAGEEMKSIYAAAMIREIRGYAEAMKDYKVTSIFAGGGTPSVMPVRELRRIFRALRDSFQITDDAEITMEINPGTVTPGLLPFIYDEINRVSMGLQSANDRELQLLGRIHTLRDFEKSYELLRETGLQNINIDLMSAIPDQTEQSWEETLRTACSFEPQHISAYSLIIEDGTPFERLYSQGKLRLPDEEAERRMYYKTKEILAGRGYEQYEISNYAKPGFRSRHNSRYWQRGSYLGLGLGASSLIGETRWKNTDQMDLYLKESADPQKLVTEMEELDRRSAIEEFMFLGLRMTDGITEEDFRNSFSLELQDIYGETLQRLEEEEMLQHDANDRYRLTERGIDLSNRVLSAFLFD
ncbi:MAG: radical SAM family heme chaperone HemW [Lachnospiraceae bacterium]|nr:radical SAM family heme chaperone HemW [Lachnospiraceae bacterium]